MLRALFPGVGPLAGGTRAPSEMPVCKASCLARGAVSWPRSEWPLMGYSGPGSVGAIEHALARPPRATPQPREVGGPPPLLHRVLRLYRALVRVRFGCLSGWVVSPLPSLWPFLTAFPASRDVDSSEGPWFVIFRKFLHYGSLGSSHDYVLSFFLFLHCRQVHTELTLVIVLSV